MEPSGDVAYVTCGPFECTESGMEIPAAPAISVENSAVCTTFEADLQFVVGVVDPLGGADRDGDAAADLTEPFESGLDLGVIYTANSGFGVTHGFGSFMKSGFGGSKTSSPKALKAGISNPNTSITTDNMDILDAAKTVVVDVTGCESVMHPLYAQAGPSALNVPAECFRITAKEGDNYLADYSVTATPSAGLKWSNNTWSQIPKVQKCAGTTFAASDQVDVCQLLEDEIALLDEGSVSAQPVVSAGGDTVTGINATRANQVKLQGFDLELIGRPDAMEAPGVLRHDHCDDKRDMGDLYDATVSTAEGYYTANTKGRLTGEADYTDATSPTQAEEYGHRVWVSILDKNGAPMYGDLGKVDAAAELTTLISERTTEDNAHGRKRRVRRSVWW